MRPAAHIATCMELLREFKGQNAPFKRFHKEFFKTRRYAGSKDRRAVFNMAMQIFRHYYNLSRIISACGLPDDERSLILVYLYTCEGKDSADLQALFMGGYTPEPLTADELQALSLLAGFDGFDDALELPDFLLPSLLQNQGEVILSSFAFMSRNILKPYFRSNPNKGERLDILEDMEGDGIAVKLAQDADDDIPSLTPHLIELYGDENIDLRNYPLYQNGLIEVQDKGAQILCNLVNITNKRSLWDYCAGAGGKSLYLASQNPNLNVILSDVTAGKLKEAQMRFKRAGLPKPKVAILPKNLPALNHLKGQIDVLILDVPCSGTGTWQRNPDLKLRLSPERLEEIMATQRQIIDDALPYLKTGGTLYYMTCSLLAQENEQQVAYILENHASMKLIPITEHHSIAHELKEKAQAKGFTKEPTSPYLKIYPNVENSDGFFMAVLEKK
ncbi:MAG: RsmB/NOP family class I SAM-dependent RNA methyltransferase [Alphaproteobacteria bacterium]